MNLVFRGIEAANPSRLDLLFLLEAEAPVPGHARIDSWHVELDGHRVGFIASEAGGFNLDYPRGNFPIGTPVPLRLNMDITALSARALAPKDEYNITLITELEISSGPEGTGNSPTRLEVRGIAAFLGVQAPDFRITEIAILKAELINTRFRVALTIDNPNPFPVELSAFSYVLYGNGRLWSDGTEKDVFTVPPKSSTGANLYLIMNFINMERNLLDQIIRLQDVNYHFTGEAQVLTGVEYLPRFNTGFNLSGYSEVLEK
jgi:LEA14-like dessication related protein